VANYVPLAQIDNRIVRKAQRGDPHAFTLIVRAYQVPVFNYVLRTVGDRGLAEDLTQEVFLRVFQSLPSFSFRSKFTTWLFQVTRHRMLDELRARERRPRCIELDSVHTLSVVDAPVEQAETIEALWRAVDRLALDLKMALLLRDIAGFSYNEIAEILEITLATVKWRIHKAREEVHLMLTRPDVVTTRPAEDASGRRLRAADGAC
jgi:RNA polymerase sigma-70 factor (ECF subfamily)